MTYNESKCIKCFGPRGGSVGLICNACRTIETFEQSARTTSEQLSYSLYNTGNGSRVLNTNYTSNYVGKSREQERLEMLAGWIVYLIIDYNLNWFIAKFAWFICNLMYIMIFSWWI